MTATTGSAELLANRIELIEPVKLKDATGEFANKCIIAATIPERDTIVEALHRLAARPAEDVREALPDDIRALGWMVAVHNDYRQLGEPHTFWLFTKDGRAIKGEGMSDAEALNKVRAALSTPGQPKP